MTPFARNPIPMNTGFHGQFPYRGGMPMLPAKPNPLAVAKQPQTTPATAEGIQALKQALSERPTPSESKTYKFEKNPMAFGQDAVDSLSPYMKQAGLNQFQTQFFSRLITSGLSRAQIQQAVKAAGDRFGPDVQTELNTGLEKLSVWPFDQAWSAAQNGLNRVGSTMQSGVDYARAIPGRLRQGIVDIGSDIGAGAIDRSNAGKGVTDKLNQLPDMSGISKSLAGMPDMLKQLAPYLMMGALGGGGGAMAGGGGGAALGGLGLPLLMYLMMNQQGKATPFDGLGSMFGNMFGMNNQTTNKPPATNPGAGANTASAPPANTTAAPATTQPANTPPATPAVNPPVPPPPPAAPAAAAKPPVAPAQSNTDYNATPVNPEPGSLGFKVPRPNFSPMKLPVSGRMMS